VYAGTYGGQHFCMLDTVNMVNNIKQEISKGYKKVIFDNINEAVYFDIIRKIHKIIRLLDNPNIEYYYLCSAYNGQDVYESYCKKNKINPILTVKCSNLFEVHQKGNLEYYNSITNSSYVEYSPTPKSKLFCCFNKMPREHRINIFYNILKSGFLEKTYSSFQYGHDIINQTFRDKQLVDTFKQHKDIFPLMLNMSDERQNPVDVRQGDFIYHSDSYFSLITETLFYKDYIEAGESIFLTEKTFRPIIHKHPFILVAPTHSLKYLEDLGYKTFSPFINESYDSIEDDNKRFNEVWKEVERLCSFSPKEWSEWQHGIIDIVNHNFKILMNKNSGIIK